MSPVTTPINSAVHFKLKNQIDVEVVRHPAKLGNGRVLLGKRRPW